MIVPLRAPTPLAAKRCQALTLLLSFRPGYCPGRHLGCREALGRPGCCGFAYRLARLCSEGTAFFFRCYPARHQRTCRGMRKIQADHKRNHLKQMRSKHGCSPLCYEPPLSGLASQASRVACSTSSDNLARTSFSGNRQGFEFDGVPGNWSFDTRIVPSNRPLACGKQKRVQCVIDSTSRKFGSRGSMTMTDSPQPKAYDQFAID